MGTRESSNRIKKITIFFDWKNTHKIKINTPLISSKTLVLKTVIKESMKHSNSVIVRINLVSSANIILKKVVSNRR